MSHGGSAPPNALGGDTSKAKERRVVMCIDASSQGSSSLVKRRSLAGRRDLASNLCMPAFILEIEKSSLVT
jgi:hypothetical protein